MKKLAWVCISAMTLTSLACGVKDSASTKYAKTKPAVGNDKAGDSKTATAEKLKACVPGEAGVISIGGKLIENGIIKDKTITTIRVFGKKEATSKVATAQGIFTVMTEPTQSTLAALEAESKKKGRDKPRSEKKSEKAN